MRQPRRGGYFMKRREQSLKLLEKAAQDEFVRRVRKWAEEEIKP